MIKYMKIDNIISLLYFIGLIILSIIYVQHNLDGAVDDSYITYKYAYNFMNGHGLLFNEAERYYGSTAMGYAILLATITKISAFLAQPFGVEITIPFIGIVLSAVSLMIINIVLYLIVIKKEHSRLLVLFLIPFSIYLYTAYTFNSVPGHETYLYLAMLMIASYYVVVKDNLFAGSILLGLSALIRPDTLLFSLIALIIIFIKNWNTNSSVFLQIKKYSKYILLFMVIIIIWELFLYSYFGTPIPGTMKAKQAQIYLGYWSTFSMRNSLSEIYKIGFQGFTITIFLAIIIFLTHKKKFVHNELFWFAILWFLFGLGLQVSYSTFGVTLWSWYITPIYFSYLIFIFSVGILIARNKIPVSLFILFVILSAIYLENYKHVNHTLRYWVSTKNVNLHTSSYTPIEEYLKINEPEGTTIAIAEPGAFAYKLGDKYRVVDVLGLISEGVAQSIIDGDREYLYNKWNPKYVVVSWVGKYNADDTEWFKKRYKLEKTFTHEYWEKHLGHDIKLYKLLDESMK